MTAQEDRFIQVLNETLDRREILAKAAIDQDPEHQAHHAYIQTMIDREKRRQLFWEKIQAQVFGWGAVAIAGAIGTVVLKAMRAYLASPN